MCKAVPGYSLIHLEIKVLYSSRKDIYLNKLPGGDWSGGFILAA